MNKSEEFETRDVDMELTGKQRAQLRGLANQINTILEIGKNGISENVIRQADKALEARELIKCRVLKNNMEDTARTAADRLALATGSAVVQVIGSRFVLYRESRGIPKEERVILIPAADGKTQAGKKASV